MTAPVDQNAPLPLADTSHADAMLPLEPMDAQVTSIQPGDAYVVHLELAWGRVRRWWLKTFRSGYVTRMRQTRRGDENRCPHEVLDPRDVKFYRNQGGYWWDPADDPFAWRDRLPFARVGLTELWTISGAFVVLAGVLVWLAAIAPAWLAWFPGILALAAFFFAGCVVWFFRNPRRVVPTEPTGG